MDISTKNNLEKAAELVARLQASLKLGEKDDEDQEKNWRYVIYVRKSTDDKSESERKKKQLRAIGDQITACKALAQNLGLRYVEIIHEEKSAKISDQRPLFSEMLENLRKGKYDGIITWASDRLARNMKEGGEIIDMLDRGEIKDIKFANNFIFENDPSGKMLLGITFVMAKQYSDQHSQNVIRAIDLKTQEGKWAGSKGKHGYWKNKDHFFLPDGENHGLISEAFRLRLEGRQLKDIAAFLIERGFPVTTKHTKHKKLTIDERFVSKILHDPIYTGVMLYRKNLINLFEKYDFEPAVLPEDFEKVCSLDKVNKNYSVTQIVRPESIRAKLMNGMIVCGNCGHTMSASLKSKNLKAGLVNYFHYRCDTKGCKSKGKTTRAKIIRAAAVEFLKHHPLASERGYKHYLDQMDKLTAGREKDLNERIRSFNSQKHAVGQKIADLKELSIEFKDDKVLKKEYQNDLKENLKKFKELEEKITDLKNQKDNNTGLVITVGEFLELFKNLANSIEKIGKMSDLDFIMRKIFLNFTVTNKKVTKITQNSPFRELCLDTDSVMVNQRGERNC